MRILITTTNQPAATLPATIPTKPGQKSPFIHGQAAPAVTVYQTQEAMNTSDYDNIEFYDLYVKKNGAPENVSLIDGNIVSTDIDCIMAKPAVLDFD